MEPPLPRSQVLPSHLPDHGLTALHIAVIRSDGRQIKKLLDGNKEYAVNARTSSGAGAADGKGDTPLMLACLFGRDNIFFYLLSAEASFNTPDDHQKALEYVQHLPSCTGLLRRYEALAGDKPSSRHGRRKIWNFLRNWGPATGTSRGDDSAARRVHIPEASKSEQGINKPRSDDEAATSEGLGNDEETATLPRDDNSMARIIFLRKGGAFEVVKVHQLSRFEMDRPLGRKTCGGIRGEGEAQFRAFAMSGWIGNKARQQVNCNLLNNAEYIKSTRKVAAMFGYELNCHPLDDPFPGTSLEKKGSFLACHAEKQLAVHVLQETIGQVLDTYDFTPKKIAELRVFVDAHPDNKNGFHFTISLEHKPCYCCLAFLQLLGKKSGLRFDYEFTEWFQEGKRPRILKKKDGCMVPASPDDDFDASEYDIGEDLGVEDVVMEPQSLEDRRTYSQSLEDRDYQEEGVKKLPQKAGSAVPEGEEAQVPNLPKYFHAPPAGRPQSKKRKTKDHRRQSVTYNPASSSTVAVASSPPARSMSSEDDFDFIPEPSPRATSLSTDDDSDMIEDEPFPDAKNFMYDSSKF